MKANRIAGRQRQLLSEVPESLRTRGVFLKGTLSANTLASLCEQNEHTFRPTTGPSGKITGYQIVDSSGDLVASGRLKATVFAPQDRYLPQKEVRSLLGQLDDATLQNYIKGISPDTIDAVHESDAEVQEFAEQHSESGDDQERGEHSEGPDQSSTGKP